MKSLHPFVFLAALACVAPLLAQQGTRATASLSEPRVVAGDPVEYSIEVNGARTASQPSQILVPGLVITQRGQMSSYSFVPGSGVVASVTYTYLIETSKAGTFTIPAQEFAAGGTMVRTNPVTLTVEAAGGSGAGSGRQTEVYYFAELIIPKKEMFVGESVPIEIRCYFDPRVRADPDMNPVLSGEGFTAQKFTEPVQDTVMVEGRPYGAFIYKSSLTPLKPGTLSVGPINFNCAVIVPRPRPRTSPRNPFNDPFFSDPFGAFGIQKRVDIKSQPVAIEVKPLPPGAPASFGGAIGQFTLEQEAQPRRAGVGDPISMHLTVRGRGNFDRIEAPRLIEEAGWRAYPATGKFKADDDVKLSGAKAFEQVIVPTERKSLTPRYEFTYLDPAKGEYKTLTVAPLPVEVTGGPEPTPAPLTRPTPAESPSATPKPVARPSEDILHIRTDGPGGGSFVPYSRRPGFWIVQGAVLAMLAGFGASRWWRNRPSGVAAREAAARRSVREGLLEKLRSGATTRAQFFEAALALAQLDGRAQDEDVREALRAREELAFGGGEDEPLAAEERERVLALLVSPRRELIRK